MLKIYTDTSFINETFRRKLFPLVFDLCFRNNEQIKKYYVLEQEATCADIIIMPINYQAFIEHKVAFTQFEQLAQNLNKPVWIYTSGDFGYTLKTDYYNFRLGGFQSKLSFKDFIIPSFINDPYLFLKDEFRPLKKSKKAQIGFVGHAQSGLNKFAKELAIHTKRRLKQSLSNKKEDIQGFYPSAFKRAKYLNILEVSDLVDAQFVFRNKYRAGVTNESDKETTTTEFYKNMNANAYTFCIRGVGNFSVRFYETLAMGRIPVLIDTDCKLPLEEEINWQEHACIIKEKDIKQLPKLVAQYHDNLSEEDFEAIQISNRNLWKHNLERIAYFKQIHNQFTSL